MTRYRKRQDDTPLYRRRSLRQTSTKPEQLIWAALRNRRLAGLKFRRQHSIGPYIVDFICVEEHLIVELDGGYHDDVVDEDLARQRFLQSQGYTVLRFWNEDVLQDVESVATAIVKAAGVPPHSNPLPHRVADKNKDEGDAVGRQHDGGEGTDA